ncbi:MAG: hypothetical protein ACE5EN_10030 [Nitrospinota bacterium]
MQGDEDQVKRSYWVTFYDDIMLLFFLSAAITFISYTVWGLVEIGTVPVSPLIKQETAAAPKAAAKKPIAAVGFWKEWKIGTKGQFPPCGTNVMALGLDQVLQDTVDAYCGLEPGHYKTYINPAARSAYDEKADTYPDGLTAILTLPKLGVGFVTFHKDGKAYMDAITLADSMSIASSEPGHPLNPQFCINCHTQYLDMCKGWVCGNRND